MVCLLYVFLSTVYLSVSAVSMGLVLQCLFVYFCVSLSDCLSVCRSAGLLVCLSVCLSACLSACLSVYSSVCLSVCLSACPSVCLSVCLFDCLSNLGCMPSCITGLCIVKIIIYRPIYFFSTDFLI